METPLNNYRSRLASYQWRNDRNIPVSLTSFADLVKKKASCKNCKSRKMNRCILKNKMIKEYNLCNYWKQKDDQKTHTVVEYD